MPQVVLRAGNTPPPLSQRYFTQLDGQSKYWRRIEPNYGQATTATLECLFFGGSGSGVQYLVGRHSSDRFYIALIGSDLVYGNGSNSGVAPTAINLLKINRAKLVADGTDVKFYVNSVLISTQAQGWSGLLDEVGFGVKGDQLLDFYSGILVSARVTTDTVDNKYGLDKNLAYELADGTTDPLADSTLIFENGSIDGSDRLLVTEKEDGTGFVDADRTYAQFDDSNLTSDVQVLDGDTVTKSVNNSWRGAVSNQTITGKVYFETVITASTDQQYLVGVMSAGGDPRGQLNSYLIGFYGFYDGIYDKFSVGGPMQPDQLIRPYVAGDTVGIAFDSDLKRIWLLLNGVVASGDPTNGVGGYTLADVDDIVPPYLVAAAVYEVGATRTINFGQEPMNFSAPEGFKQGVYTDRKVYDYATGAAPVDSYGTEYSTAYS